MSAKFQLGDILASPAALEALKRNQQRPIEFISRHVRGDWGIAFEDALHQNNMALSGGGLSILSAYKLRDDTEIWLITQADRSATAFFLASEIDEGIASERPNL